MVETSTVGHGRRKLEIVMVGDEERRNDACRRKDQLGLSFVDSVQDGNDAAKDGQK